VADDLIKLIQFLVSIGLGPIDIVLVVVAIALYAKSEKLDAQLHDCLSKVKAVLLPETAKSDTIEIVETSAEKLRKP